MNKFNHSVAFVSEKCVGCTDCIKRCPTAAIRVRNGKAVIIDEKCIDCGMCIRVCRNHAKKAVTQPADVIGGYKFKVALPAPTLYAQFKNVTNVNYILTALKRFGFDEVFEVSYAAELVTEMTKKYIEENNPKRPIISSACPVVTRLISMNFPSLLQNLLPIISPMETAAVLAKETYAKRYGIKKEDIGVFFLSPCPAKATNVVHPMGIEKSAVDGVISLADIFLPLRSIISGITEPEQLVQCSIEGMYWARTGGELKGLCLEDGLAVEGLENVIIVLESIENGQLQDVDFVELLSCTGGCVGGVLAPVYGYIARTYLQRLQRNTPPAVEARRADFDLTLKDLLFTTDVAAIGRGGFGGDMGEALRKMEAMDKIIDQLPNIDCGSCGAPTCKTLAEDIVNGEAHIEDCVFMLRKKVSELAGMMVDLSSKLPQTFRDEKVKK